VSWEDERASARRSVAWDSEGVNAGVPNTESWLLSTAGVKSLGMEDSG
jgi:hypothetical protein